MGLMQEIANTKCPTCVAILPAPKEGLLSKETLTRAVFEKLSLHFLCEADDEVHFTGECVMFDKLHTWLAKIMPFLEIALVLVKIAAVAAGAASAIGPIADYLVQIGLGNASSTLDGFYTHASAALNIKSELDFSSTADAMKALEAAAKQISEADKKTLEKFLMDKAPEIKPRGVVLADGNMTIKYLCARHYDQYDQTGTKIPSSPKYPFKAGAIKILNLSVSGINATKVHVEIKFLGCKDIVTPSAKSSTYDFKWTSPSELTITRANWMTSLQIEVFGRIFGAIGSARIVINKEQKLNLKRLSSLVTNQGGCGQCSF